MGGMILQPLDILVFRGQWYNPMALFIYQRTSTWYTHCAMYVGDGVIVEAKSHGVIETALAHYEGRERKVMRYRYEIHPAHVKAALDWLQEITVTSVGYDFVSYLGYITGIKAFDNPNKYACVEVPAYALKEAKVDIWNEIPAFIFPCEYVRNYQFKEVLS
jgi:uncharacterized protein YycO